MTSIAPHIAPHIAPQENPVAAPVDLRLLERSLRRPRALFSFCMSVLCAGLTLFAAIPLVSVLVMLVWRGGAKISLALFTELPPAAGMQGGGIGNAILGTLLVVLVGTVISVPVGVLGGVYLAETGRDGRLASGARFCAKLLTGLPSILAGVFVYGTVVLLTGRFSALAGGVALAVLMLPIVMLTAEEAILEIAPEVREAAVGMGATQTQLVLDILLPTALPGILTGVMLALSRAAGETAPLLFTMTFSDYWLSAHLLEPTASLAVLIFNFSKSPFESQKAFAWAASLVLVLIALCLNLGGQALARRVARR
jgi:phosphate transport system permease protein